MRKFLHAILSFAGLATQAISAEAKPAPYSAKVQFHEGQPLKFADFELVYTGKRQVSGPKFPRGWLAHDFTVRDGKAAKKISWSAGTGDIGPTRFSAGRGAYDLELSRSDKLGVLKADELVITAVR